MKKLWLRLEIAWMVMMLKLKISKLQSEKVRELKAANQ